MISKIRPKVFYSVMALMVATTSYSEVSSAKLRRIPTVQVSVSDVEKYYSGLPSDKRSLHENSQSLRLLQISQKIFNLKYFIVVGSDKEKRSELIKKVNSNEIISTIGFEISKNPKWNQIKSKNKIGIISKNRKFLKKSFEFDQYSWAWFLYQMNEQKAAKAILRGLYDTEFASVMKMKRVIIGAGNAGPLSSIKRLSPAILSMSTKKETEIIEEKNRKLKLHISNLPHSRVVT